METINYGLEIKRAISHFENSIKKGYSMQEAAQQLNNSYGSAVYNYVMDFINPNN